jgi:vacuolar-type H+-ATPase subunit C/Vma6
LTRTAKYASVSAKIGAERSNLLSKTKLRALSESKDLNDFVTQLKETTYQAQIAKTASPFPVRKLEKAFQENLIETYIRIIKNSPASASTYLITLLLRLETENIKALIKAVSADLNAEEKEARVYLAVENFLKHRPTFEEALKAADLKQLLAAFAKTEYASAFNYGLKSYEESGATTCFDVLIDKTYYERLFQTYGKLPKREKPHALFYANAESSSYILLTLLRGKILNHDANWLRVIIPDAHFLPNETVEAIVMAADFESAFKLVQKSPYTTFFEKAQTPEETVANAERAFKKAIYDHARQNRIAETFNVGMPLAFMYQKQSETSNLVTISLGVEAALKPNDIQSRLLLDR